MYARLIPLSLLAACSPLIDREVANYIPFPSHSRYLYLDQYGREFPMNVIKVDTIWAILDWSGYVEYLNFTGDLVEIYNRVEYGVNGSLVVGYEGFIPYYPYPFVDGDGHSFSYLGDEFRFTISSSVERDGMRYRVEVVYMEENPEGRRSFYRQFLFAPDTGIVEAVLGPDTLLIEGDTIVGDVKYLHLTSVE